jgi:lipopolysaccharide transport system ATP-binding protein
MDDIAIRAEHLSKMYRLGVINNGTLWKDIQTWTALRLGREDPHSKIDSDKYLGDVDHFWALKDLNFEIRAGDRVGIIGKNGAGKSTLLKILSRVTSPTEGVVRVRGKISSLLEVGTGFNGELTGRENIYLNGAILGMKKKQIDQKLDEIIDFSEIEHHIDTPVKRYSSGMYVRLAFAVAAHLDSEILIADEVLAVGDASFQRKALGKMNDLSTGQGRTVLFVSHNMGAVSALCNKGIVMDKGRIIKTGLLGDCVSEYLKAGRDSKTDAQWSGDRGDDSLRIRHVLLSSMTEGNEPKNTFLRDERALLRIDYEVRKENPNYVMCIEIFNQHGAILLETSATEYFEDRLDVINSIGSHSLSLEVDMSLFAQGEYFIKFDFAIRDCKRIITDEPTMYFKVENYAEESQVFVPKRSNVISPRWQWTII